ncbi:thioredoxin family protein [Croceibacter atlanticus]|uniref:thioredoxin family protein n=1 Tax=Croceibacter atlanticus TaxID=313588 RepID=UPI0032B18631
MRLTFFILVLCVTLMSCGHQKTAVESTATPTETTAKVDSIMVKTPSSILTKEDFMNAPYGDWFSPRYEDYSINAETAAAISKYINDYDIKVFMGTWCSDSKRETPKLYKLLEESGYNIANLEVISVDRKKVTPNNLQEGYDIIKVPTIIFSKNGKEVNRFVEYAQETLAEDILKIVSGQPYKHSYAE